jgi:CBS domain-containing protein
MFQSNGPSGLKPPGAVEAAVPVLAIQRPRRESAVGTDEDESRAPGDTARSFVRARQAAQAYGQDDAPTAPQAIRRVDELMTSQVFALDSGMKLAAALQALEASGHAQAPVIGADGKLAGLFVPPLFGFAAGVAADTPLLQVIHAPVEAAAVGTDIRAVARLLVAVNLPGLPVVDAAGRLCGFIGRGDIVRAVGQEPPLDMWI